MIGLPRTSQRVDHDWGVEWSRGCILHDLQSRRLGVIVRYSVGDRPEAVDVVGAVDIAAQEVGNVGRPPRIEWTVF